MQLSNGAIRNRAIPKGMRARAMFAVALCCLLPVSVAESAASNAPQTPAPASAKAPAPRILDKSQGYDVDPDSGVIAGGVQVPAIKPSEYSALGKLPDWSGDWAPNVAFMTAQNKSIQPPWNEEAQGKVKAYLAATAAGKPPATTASKCLPTGMPALMNQNHTFEFWFAPRRVFVFNEIDIMDIRRIYTDGRKLPDDPDLSYMGYSVGHWEGQKLVVETNGILPEVPFRVNDRYSIDNGGDMHVLEHIYLASKDMLQDDLEVQNPHALVGTWKYSRQFKRHREPFFEILESVCAQGHDTADAYGNIDFNFGSPSK